MAAALEPGEIQENENSFEEIFENGLKNPRFDPLALKDYKPIVYKSRFHISSENPTGAFPPALSSDFVLNHFTDFLKELCWNKEIGRSQSVFLQNMVIVPAKINYKTQLFRRVLIITGQNFTIDIPDNPLRPLNEVEIYDIPLKTIGTEDSDTTVVAPPGETCLNCRNEFMIGDDVIKLKCDHIFFDECIKTWLEISGSCPICDRPVRDADFDGASVRIRADGPSSGGVLGLRNTLLNRLPEEFIKSAAMQDFETFCKSGKVFPLRKTTNFTVLPLTVHMEGNNKRSERETENLSSTSTLMQKTKDIIDLTM